MKNEAVPTIECLELLTELPIVGEEIIPWTEIATRSRRYEYNYRFNVPPLDSFDGVFVTYKWYRIEPASVATAGYSLSYTPTAADVGFTLKLEMSVVSNETRNVLVVRSASTPYRVVRVPVPIYRGLISTNEAVVKGKPGTFTVLSYNILSDESAMSSLYNYCTPWARLWTYRRLNLLNEILGYGADIICLQDVQNDHFDDFLAPELRQRGYNHFYERRTNKALNRNESTIDGCAIFFKREKFSVYTKYEIDFNKEAGTLVGTMEFKDMPPLSKRLIKDNIALILILQPKPGKYDPVGSWKHRFICVANTRLDVQKDMKDVLLWHVQTLLRKISGYDEVSIDIPVVVCGDFNLNPGSLPYSVVVSGKPDQSDQYCYTDYFGMMDFPDSPQIKLSSAYAAFSRLPKVARLHKHMKKVDADSKEPLHTTFTDVSKGCEDYIFFTGNTLRVDGVLELVKTKKLSEEKALPSTQWPSNHLALMAHFSCLP